MRGVVVGSRAGVVGGGSCCGGVRGSFNFRDPSGVKASKLATFHGLRCAPPVATNARPFGAFQSMMPEIERRPV